MSGIGKSKGTDGFTLLEVIMVMAILALLAAIVFVSLAPVREKGRQVVCVSNLRQIGQALEMYRRDYQGKDPPEALASYDLGLPKDPIVLRDRYLPNLKVWKCPNEHHDFPFSGISYGWGVWDDDDPWARGVAPPFTQVVARRGDEYPIAYDKFHWHTKDPQQFWAEPRLVIVLRLNGRVQSLRVPPNAPSYEW